jgi:hypothetical protein
MTISSDDSPTVSNVSPDPVEAVESSGLPVELNSTSKLVALSNGYRLTWVFISLLGMGVGFMAGASLVGGSGVEVATAVFSLIAMIGLIATLFTVGNSGLKS